MLDNPTGRGKHLIVYDCEATMDQDFTQLRARSFMLPTQVKFIEWAKGYYRIQSIWYGNAAITPPEPNRCVHHTVTWIHAFASQLEAEYSGPEDHRLDGFALVHL